MRWSLVASIQMGMEWYITPGSWRGKGQQTHASGHGTAAGSHCYPDSTIIPIPENCRLLVIPSP